MACIIKLPNNNEKGVLTFTTPEYKEYLSRDTNVYNCFMERKSRWLIGQHHNEAHKDISFIPDPLFDFHIAGPGDLESYNGAPFYQIEMDCSNFCSNFFENKATENEKFWDVLIIARNTRFKSLPDMLHIVRKAMDQK